MTRKKPWHDDMVTIWVSPSTRKAVNDARNPEKRRRTADDVIKDALAALKEKK